MIDKVEIEYRFRRSIESYDDNAYAQKAIIRRLMTLLEEYFSLSAARILEIGCGTGLLTEQIQSEWKDCELIINDLVDEMCSRTASRCRLPATHCVAGDIESVSLTGDFGLVVSASTFQWLASPEQTFARLAQHLQPDGWLIFSTFGEDNFRELRSITGSGLVYRSIRQMIRLLSSHFDVLHTEEEHCVLEFNDPLEILKHVKRTGVNATHSGQSWTRGRLNDFAEEYTGRFLKDGQYPLTYHPLYFVCRKK